MDWVKTGVPGFDSIINGGVRKNAAVLLSGVPGTGKTIFGLHFIYDGAKQGENGLFITCEESIDSVTEYAASLGMDFKKYKENITIINQPLTGKVFSFGEVIDTIAKKKIKRVVLDSLSLFNYMTVDVTTYRREIMEFIMRMKQTGVTCFVISERSQEHIDKIRYHAEDFLFEGLILFSKIRRGASYERCITVAKMRGQKHLLGIYPFTLDEKGITVFPQELPFALIDKENEK